MIVKNGARTIERAISSVRAYVEEIDVYDTGSTDGTPWVVERLASATGGAAIRLVRGEWRDSFAWAREQSFAMASPAVTWLLYLDADEEIVGASELPAIVREAPTEADLVVFYWDIDRDAGGNTVAELWRDRMVRQGRGFRWRGAAHTALVPPERHTPVTHVVPRERAWFVHHREPGRWHPERALRLLLAEVARTGVERVDDDTLFNLANELFWRGEFEQAAEYYERYVARPAVRAPMERAHALHCLATAARAAGDLHRAEGLELTVQRELPDWPEALVGLMEAAAARNDFVAAAEWAERTLRVTPPPVSPIRDPLRLRVLPLLRLAEARLRARDLGAAAGRVAAVRGLAPGDPFVDARIDAFSSAAEAGDIPAARRVVRELVGHYDEIVQANVRHIWLEADPDSDGFDVELSLPSPTGVRP